MGSRAVTDSKSAEEIIADYIGNVYSPKLPGRYCQGDAQSLLAELRRAGYEVASAQEPGS